MTFISEKVYTIKTNVDSNQAADVRGGFLMILEKGGKIFFQKKKKGAGR